MDIGVLSTIYPNALPFLNDFLTGLTKQSDGEFRLFLVNDGVVDLAASIRDWGLPTEILSASGTPTQLRKIGLDWVGRSNIDWVVLLDADDISGPDRISRVRNTQQDCDVVFGDLIMFGDSMAKNLSMLSKRFQDGEKISRKILVEANCLGLSNCAARVDLLMRASQEIPDDVVAFDWALFTRAILDGASIRYLDGAETLYRQHSDNIAGPFDFSERQILRGVSVKARHYALFENQGPPYDRLATDFADLNAQLTRDMPFLKTYTRAVRAEAPAVPLWWQPMKLPKELGL